jgi:hypothetical protein
MHQEAVLWGRLLEFRWINWKVYSILNTAEHKVYKEGYCK